MFRIVAAATALCSALTLAAGEEKFTYDRKLTHVRLNKDTREELGRKEGLEAKAEGNPAKDAKVTWHVRASTFTKTPVPGDVFLDEKGVAWSILRGEKAPGGERYVFTTRKLPELPKPTDPKK